MGQIRKSVTIDAPAEAVFALMTDTTRFGDWVFGFAGLDEGPERLGAGAKFRWRMRGHGMTLRPRSEVVEFDAPGGYEEEIRIPGIVRATLSKRIVAQKRRTQLSWALDYRVIGGPLGVVIDWAVAHRVAERAVQRSLERAKRVLETPKAVNAARSGYQRQRAVR